MVNLSGVLACRPPRPLLPRPPLSRSANTVPGPRRVANLSGKGNVNADHKARLKLKLENKAKKPHEWR